VPTAPQHSRGLVRCGGPRRRAEASKVDAVLAMWPSGDFPFPATPRLSPGQAEAC
jgi:hypothetical protein